MAITKVINDAVDLNQTTDYSGLRLPVGTTGNVVESFTTDYLVVGGGGGTQSGGGSNYPGGGGAGGLRTSYNNSTTTTNTLSFPSGKTAIATYMLDNNATDVSENYDGGEYNITYNTGQYGGAAVFNGSSSYIDVSSLTYLFDSKATATVSLWFNTSTTATTSVLFSDYASSSARNFLVHINSTGNIVWNTRYGSGAGRDSNITTTSTYNDGNWHHIVLSIDQAANAKSMYVDGSQIGSSIALPTATGASFGSTQRVTMGSSYNTGTAAYQDYYNGKIDQVRIYDTALSFTDVTNIYNNEVQANSGGGSAAESSLTLTADVAYDVTIGGATTTGEDSTFSTITALGGGRSGGPAASAFGSNGGSGGGASGDAYSAAGGNGTLNQGYAGGSSGPSCSGSSCTYPGGGGGGATEVGTNATTTTAGNGGDGLEVNIIGGTGNYYAGGGGGSSYLSGAATGGLGGGGNGSARLSGSEVVNDGAANTGGGGGGGLIASSIPALGGSGVVILRYPTASISSFTTTGTLNTPSTTDTIADTAYPVANTAYYKLDGNVTDSSGNGNNGTPINVTYGNGRFGQAAVFNGSSSVFDTNVSVPTNWTVSLWLKRTPSGYFGGTTNASVRSGVYFYSGSNGSLSVYNRNSGGGNIDTLNTATGLVTEGNWHHIAITFDSTSGTGLTTVYVDSVNAGTLDGTPTHSTDFKFGRSGDYAVEYFNGSIDQVRIYDAALTSDQVTELYNEHYQTKFTDGSDTAIVFTEGTGTVTFSGVNPAPPQGALRANTSYSEDGSGSVIEHYNGTDWKYFDAIKYCTTNTLNFPSGAGCIASYNFNNNVDDIGNTYNGVNSNVTFNASGKFGAAAVFNGSNARIDISNVLSGFTDTYSFSIWAKINNTNNFPFFASDPTSLAATNNMRFALHQNGNYYFDFGSNSSGRMTGTTPSEWRNNNWHHFVFVSTPTQKFAYVDGSLFNTLSSTTAISGKSTLTVGHYLTNYGQGDYDQIRIFNDSLTSDEVTQLYNNEIACS